MAGKGDSPRPVDGDTYRANYERIFAPCIRAKAPRVLMEPGAIAAHGPDLEYEAFYPASGMRPLNPYADLDAQGRHAEWVRGLAGR